MNKSDLVASLAKDLGVSSSIADSLINTILEAMTDALCRGESIEIRGFGSFAIKRYDAYEGRNPKTGKRIEVKPKKLPFFKVGKELRRKVDIQKGPNKKSPVGII